MGSTKTMKIGPKYISTGLYKKILEVMPVACTDVVIVHGKNFLLGKRVNKPARGEWWFVGGRVFRGELLEEAVRRHIETETSVKKFTIKKILSAKETIFKNSAQGPGAHTINTVFLVSVPSARALSKNKENSRLAWFSKIDRHWHPYVRAMLRLAGFK